MTKGPILIELDDSSDTQERDAPRPETAPPVPDAHAAQDLHGRAMQHVTQVAAYRPSKLTRLFWAVASALIVTVVSLAAWDYANGLIARVPILGYAFAGLGAFLCLILAIMATRELAALARLKRLDKLQTEADNALASGELAQARRVVFDLHALYKNRSDTQWGRDRLAERMQEQFDADALLALAEQEILTPLDKAAMTEIETAARQVATVTALVPLALADVIAALTANLRMIRRIATIYGGRSGVWGNWRLTRAVMAHLVATGAVAIGDDLISSVAGGGILSRVSRRFGEGLVNGALTARVGVAAMEVCRPLPFILTPKPSVTALVRRALTGVFGALNDKSTS